MKATAFIFCYITERQTFPILHFTFHLLLYNPKFLANLYERGNCLVKVFLFMSSRELDTDTGLALWNNRIVETGYENSLLCHFLRKHL